MDQAEDSATTDTVLSHGGWSHLFAGVYESWFPRRNQPQLTFTIITGAANGVIAPIHDECRCCSMSAGPTIG
jgi:putative SOS response-associated peptidase YedK